MGEVQPLRPTVSPAPAMPLEPLYSSRVVAEMVPFSSLSALHMFLHRHKDEFPGRYRRTGVYEQRLFTLSEIIKMRNMTVRSVDMSNRGRPARRSANGIVNAVMRRAMGGA